MNDFKGIYENRNVWNNHCIKTTRACCVFRYFRLEKHAEILVTLFVYRALSSISRELWLTFS